MERDNATQVLMHFVRHLKAPITSQSIIEQLDKHPDYGSLLAYSDILENFNIQSGAYQVPFNQLSEVPLPFIAHMNNHEFCVVTDFNDTRVKTSTGPFKSKTLSAANFKQTYSGSILIGEVTQQSGEKDYAAKRQKEFINRLRMPVALAGGLGILLIYLLLHSAYISSLNTSLALLTLAKTAGLATAILLLIQSIDANNPLIQKLCGGDNNKDCNAILSSKAAKVNSYLSWSEVGFFYFAGTWLVTLFYSNHPAAIQVLVWLNLVSLPYTFYSIYYQWRVVKQWCVFCCTVQAILWVEFFCFLPYLLKGIAIPNLAEAISITSLMILPVLAWILVKPYLLQAKQIAPLKAQLRLFKYNKELFDAALKEQPKYVIPADDWSIVLGNVEANNIITMVSNPYCQPCGKAHAQIEEALNNLDNIQVRVVFVGNNANENDTKSRVHRHLMGLNAMKDKTVIKRALHDWYEQKQKNYDEWAKAYPITGTTDVNAQLTRQKEWVTLAEISATPTLLVNGHKLPPTYQLHELKYMLQ